MGYKYFTSKRVSTDCNLLCVHVIYCISEVLAEVNRTMHPEDENQLPVRTVGAAAG